MVKMIVCFAKQTKSGLNKNQVVYSILRNFGGFNVDKFSPLKIFEEYCPRLNQLPTSEDGKPPTDAKTLIESGLSGESYSIEE